MDFLDAVEERITEVEDKFQKAKNKGPSAEVIKVKPELIGNWEYRDRQSFELGDIDGLAESIKNNGQAQPIIIVEKSNVFKERNKSNKTKYIVIAGYRRWLACQKSSLSVEAILKSLTFEQAVSCLLTENEKESVSDYSKGLFYCSLYKEKKVKKDVFEKLGLTKSVFNNFLSFSDVPDEIWKAVGDVKKISARTSGEIKRLSLKGDDYIEAIISIADKISNGIGSTKILSLVEKYINKKQLVPKEKKENLKSYGKVQLKTTESKIVLNLNRCGDGLKQKIKNDIDLLLNQITKD